MIVSDLGMNVLKGKIGKVINERYGVAVSSDDLEQVLRNRYFSTSGKIFEDSKIMIEEMKLEHLQQIISDIHCIGGGAIMLLIY